jgi:hypothetical protein
MKTPLDILPTLRPYHEGLLYVRAAERDAKQRMSPMGRARRRGGQVTAHLYPNRPRGSNGQYTSHTKEVARNPEAGREHPIASGRAPVAAKGGGREHTAGDSRPGTGRGKCASDRAGGARTEVPRLASQIPGTDRPASAALDAGL